ncbi:hypothetical protein EVAR_14958_1 [Eumeta japonica]|uniref:RNA-directed DNA polymerase from mobile element jockey n=1 Tax=Eumeta variegata TaxID=151549 RepID=A0A4C1XP38_EUMVA|nr:hypothetical protein EVAR_14958_1 [Eumeta japonica]
MASLPPPSDILFLSKRPAAYSLQRSQVSANGGDHLLLSGSYARLPLDNVVEKNMKQAVSVYLPSHKKLLRRDLRALLALGDTVILFGDFNCKSPRTSQRRSPNPTLKITDWKRVSTALEKIDTPSLNSIPNDSNITDEIDSAVDTLTNHVRTVVEKSRREVSASSDRRRLPADVLELIKTENAALRCASAYPTTEHRSRARALQRRERARVEKVRNENWSDLMEEITPSHKAFWKVTKALETEGYISKPPFKKPDNSVALEDAEIAECLADDASALTRLDNVSEQEFLKAPPSLPYCTQAIFRDHHQASNWRLMMVAELNRGRYRALFSC